MNVKSVLKPQTSCSLSVIRVRSCANENGAVLYQSKEKKDDEGVKDSPLEFYEGTTISDHESALIKHGSRHQECMVHVRRYVPQNCS